MNDTPAPHTVIVIGVDSPIGLSVVRDLGSHGLTVVGVGSRKLSIGRASRWTRSFFLRPKGIPIGAWIIPLIVKHQAQAVYAISENDLIELSEFPETIAGCPILTPRSEPLALVLDKSKTLEIAAKMGMDVPHSWQPSQGDDFSGIAAQLQYPVAVKWNDPMLVSPKLDAAGLGFVKVEYADSKAALLEILIRYAEIRMWPLVQTWCPGVGIGQMLLMHSGKAALRFQHRRVHEWPATGGVSSLCAVEPSSLHAAQMVKSEALLQAIGWHGPAMVEYRYDANSGRYWLMEINGRFWGSLPLAFHSGAHFAWDMYRLNKEPGAVPAEHREFKPVKACYAVPEIKRAFGLLRGEQGAHGGLVSRFKLALSDGAVLLDPKLRFYVWSWLDPLPFFADLLSIISKALPILGRKER